MRMRTPNRSDGWGRVSHSGLISGLYVTGAVACLAQTTGFDRHIPGVSLAAALAFAFLVSTAVYLLDRVKIRDRWLDPADARAHSRRYRFVAAHSGPLRATVVAMLVLGSWLGWLLDPWLALAPVTAGAGVLLYAARPRGPRPRPKDILVLKNLYVAVGISGFAAVVVLAAAEFEPGRSAILQSAFDHAQVLAWAGFLLAGRVLADAVLSDMDDVEADQQFGTQTLPNRFGRGRAGNLAMSMRLGMAVMLALSWPLPWDSRIGWAAVTVASSIALRIAAPFRVRDWVDTCLALEAVAVGVLTAAIA